MNKRSVHCFLSNLYTGYLLCGHIHGSTSLPCKAFNEKWLHRLCWLEKRLEMDSQSPKIVQIPKTTLFCTGKCTANLPFSVKSLSFRKTNRQTKKLLLHGNRIHRNIYNKLHAMDFLTYISENEEAVFKSAAYMTLPVQRWKSILPPILFIIKNIVIL